MRKTNAEKTHHADETAPKIDNFRGMYPDLSHNHAQTIAAKPKKGRPT